MLQLPIWNFTNIIPSFNDLESGTAIEMTAKVYGAMRDLIDEYNKFVENTNKEISEFETSSTKNYEEFAIGLRQEFQDFIDIINLKVMEQDSVIQDAVNYMKNNLEESIANVVIELQNSGALNKELRAIYSDILNELSVMSSRMDTFTSLNEGSTTGDAELADGRVDFLGETHENIGAHIRTITSRLDSKVTLPQNTNFFITSKNLYDKYDKDILREKFIDASGNIQVNTDYATTGFIPVLVGHKYSASDKGFTVTFYDKNKNFHSSLSSSLHTGYVTIPEGVYFARFTLYLRNLWTFQVEESEECTPFEQHYSYIPSKFNELTAKLRDVNFTSFGDSITARNGWQSLLVDFYHLNHTNLGIGSTTLAYVESVENSYPCMINSERIQAIKDSNPDILTILGGCNDVVRNVEIGTNEELSKALEEKDKTTFFGALSYLIETMLNWKPTINIILLTTMYTNVPAHNLIYEQYANATREAAYYYGLKIADTNRESGITKFNTSNYTEDGVHPNAAGYIKIANIVASQIEDIYRI